MAVFRASVLLLLCLFGVFLVPSSGCFWRGRRRREKPKTTTTMTTTTQAPTLPPGELCCTGRAGGRTEPTVAPFHMGISPTGEHANSTVCFYYKSTDCIVCTSPAQPKETRCCTKALTGAASDIPVNEYLIFFNSDQGVFDLNPLSVNGDVYLTPLQADNNGQFGWSIHGESFTTEKGVTVEGDSCWSEISNTVKSGQLTHLGIELQGFLYVLVE